MPLRKKKDKILKKSELFEDEMVRIDFLYYCCISRSSQCSTTGVTKAVVCAILSGMVHIKEPLLLIGKSSLCGGSVFPFSLSEWFLAL